MHSSHTPNWFNIAAHTLPWGFCFYFFFVTFSDPGQMALYVAKDHVEGGGLVERLTVIVLVPGIIAAIYALIRYRQKMTSALASTWLLLWILACIYFAGEEISWGQWIFEWQTPESISRLNDQNETNFHNTSTWLDQKPRTLVELWIFFAGTILPLISLFQRNPYQKNWQYWIHPVSSMVSAGLFFTVVRISGWIEIPEFEDLFGSSEFRELSIAVFLSLFLLSFYARLRNTV